MNEMCQENKQNSISLQCEESKKPNIPWELDKFHLQNYPVD